MTKGRRYIYLYLTLACFLGLIAIFIVDGYMGLYDTIIVTSGEQTQELGPDFWQQDERFWSAGAARDEVVGFSYRLDNRTFSDYTADVDVSIWRSQEKVADVISERVSVASFQSGQIDWTVDVAEVIPADTPAEAGFQFTVVINRPDLERRVIMHVSPAPFLPKPVVPR